MTKPGPSTGGNGDGTENVIVEYDAENGSDPADVHAKTAHIKVDFNRAKVEFFFMQLEMFLESAGCKSQWMKRLILQRNLPQDVIEDIQDILSRGKAAAGATAYKDAKSRILQLYGVRKEDRYKKAKGLMLTGKPSQLCRQLINELCPSHPTLEGCCAEATISGMWREQLPTAVRVKVADCELGGGNLQATLEIADNAHATLQAGAGQGAAVAAVAADDEVAAFSRQKGGKGNVSKSQTPKGGKTAAKEPKEPHPDNPPDDCCAMHKQFGKSAYFCKQPFSCPWKDICARPKPKK